MSNSTAPASTSLFPELFRDEVFRLETRRLWLRWPKAADAAKLGEIVAVAACAHVDAQWPLAWDGKAGSLAGLILRMRAANAAGEGCFLVLADKMQPDVPLGVVGIDTLADGGPSLGFLLDVRRQGYGLMTEAARALMCAAQLYSGLDVIRGDTAMTGLGARRVLEKAGFRPVARREGVDERASDLEMQREASPAARRGVRPRPCVTSEMADARAA